MSLLGLTACLPSLTASITISVWRKMGAKQQGALLWPMESLTSALARSSVVQSHRELLCCWKAKGVHTPWLVTCIKMWPRNLLSFSHYHPLAFVTGSARHSHPGMARRSPSKLFEGAGADHRSRLPRSAFCPLVPEPHKLWP